MNKAFTKETDDSDSPPLKTRFAPLPLGIRNLITVQGSETLKEELAARRERLEQCLDEAEKKTLKHEVEELSQRLETHLITATESPETGRVGFGSTVRLRDEQGGERLYALVGLDEADASAGRVSWTSPLARAIWQHSTGDIVTVRAPGGDTEYEIIQIEV